MVPIECDIRQLPAIPKVAIRQHRALGNRNAFDWTPGEDPVTKRGQALRKGTLRQSGIGESTNMNVGNTVRNLNASQARAVVEC